MGSLYIYKYLFIIPVLIGFVSPGFILLIKRCVLIFFSESSPREECMFFLKGETIIMNAIDDNSCRYSFG